jgi:hypothetical protein
MIALLVRQTAYNLIGHYYVFGKNFGLARCIQEESSLKKKTIESIRKKYSNSARFKDISFQRLEMNSEGSKESIVGCL